MKKSLVTLALLALFVPAITGCGKEPNSPVKTASAAPAVPPAGSMNFDFSFFTKNGAAQTYAAHPNGVAQTADASNWINAVVRVVYLNLTIADVFSPEVSALQAALSQKPVLGDDGWFQWTYAFNNQGHDVTLKLRAHIDGALVNWQMLITDPQATPPATDFVWFTGQTRLQNDRGFWLFNDRRNGDAVPIARIDWNNVSDTDRSLIFQNVDATSVDLHSTLAYTVADSVTSITYTDGTTQQTADIMWNSATGAGSLRTPDYNSGERACWDEHQQNTVCPADATL